MSLVRWSTPQLKLELNPPLRKIVVRRHAVRAFARLEELANRVGRAITAILAPSTLHLTSIGVCGLGTYLVLAAGVAYLPSRLASLGIGRAGVRGRRTSAVTRMRRWGFRTRLLLLADRLSWRRRRRRGLSMRRRRRRVGRIRTVLWRLGFVVGAVTARSGSCHADKTREGDRYELHHENVLSLVAWWLE